MPIDQVIPGNKHRRRRISLALNEPELQGPHNKTTEPSLFRRCDH